MHVADLKSLPAPFMYWRIIKSSNLRILHHRTSPIYTPTGAKIIFSFIVKKLLIVSPEIRTKKITFVRLCCGVVNHSVKHIGNKQPNLIRRFINGFNFR